MAEVRISIQVDFEHFESGFIRADSELPNRRVWSPWLIVVPFVLEWLLPVTAVVFVIRNPVMSLSTRLFLAGVLFLPAIRCLFRSRRLLDLGCENPFATSDSRFEISVRPDGWTLSTANTRAEHRWALVARVVRFDAGFVVVENWAGQSARWLPLTGFESAAAADEFVELVRGAAVAFEDQRSGKSDGPIGPSGFVAA